MKTKTEKQSVARKMARGIASDLGSLVSNGAKVAAKIASLPLVGMLSPEIRGRIYGENTQGDWSTVAAGVSCITNIPVYLAGGYLTGRSLFGSGTEAELLGCMGGMIGILEAIRRFNNLTDNIPALQNIPQSTFGYLPSKAINYISEKYDNAKKNIERDVKGGNE